MVFARIRASIEWRRRFEYLVWFSTALVNKVKATDDTNGASLCKWRFRNDGGGFSLSIVYLFLYDANWFFTISSSDDKSLSKKHWVTWSQDDSTGEDDDGNGGAMISYGDAFTTSLLCPVQLWV